MTIPLGPSNSSNSPRDRSSTTPPECTIHTLLAPSKKAFSPMPVLCSLNPKHGRYTNEASLLGNTQETKEVYLGRACPPATRGSFPGIEKE